MSELSEAYCDHNGITKLNASGCSLLRALTCKGCKIEELDLTGCATLDLFDCSDNHIAELDVSDCVSVTDIECADNDIESLDVSGCVALQWLNCANNSLTSLDLTCNPELEYLRCTENRLKTLDLTCNPGLPFDMISASGNGFIGFSNYGYIDDYGYWVSMNAAAAAPAPNAEFLGWYSESGELISENTELAPGAGRSRVTARFTGGAALLGDANGDGSVDSADALIVLRASMGIVQLSEETASACDVDHNGVLNTADALMILRYAMGLIEGFPENRTDTKQKMTAELRSFFCRYFGSISARTASKASSLSFRPFRNMGALLKEGSCAFCR